MTNAPSMVVCINIVVTQKDGSLEMTQILLSKICIIGVNSFSSRIELVDFKEA